MALWAFFSLGFLIAGPSLRGAEAACCHMEWLPSANYCYKLFIDKASWAEAEISCQNNNPGGHLASIHSATESAELAKYIMKYRKDGSPVWIGLRDPLKNRRWLWTDQSSNSYKNWHAGEPNNRSNNENCVELWSASGYMKWNDENCKSERPYLCQYRLQDGVPASLGLRT